MVRSHPERSSKNRLAFKRRDGKRKENAGQESSSSELRNPKAGVDGALVRYKVLRKSPAKKCGARLEGDALRCPDARTGGGEYPERGQEREGRTEEAGKRFRKSAIDTAQRKPGEGSGARRGLRRTTFKSKSESSQVVQITGLDLRKSGENPYGDGTGGRGE